MIISVGAGFLFSQKKGNGSPIIVFDNFDRADNPTSLGVADTGHVWSGSGTWGIQNNNAKHFTGSGRQFIYVDSGVSDCAVSVIMADIFNQSARFAFRATDNSNNYHVLANGTQYNLSRNEAGVITNIGTIPLAPVDGDRIKVVLSGDTMTVFINDVQKLQVTGQTFNLTATKHGLGTFGTDTDTFDAFSVEVLP